MEDIICIIISFFLLGLIVNHFKPIFEGIDNCESKAETSLTDLEKKKGEKSQLDDDKQKEYERWKKEEKSEKDRIYSDKNCLRTLINKNSALVKSFKDNDFKPLDDKYTTELEPTAKSFRKSKREFNESKNALYDLVADEEEGEEEEKEETTVGEIDDPAGASPDEDIGKPIDSGGHTV